MGARLWGSRQPDAMELLQILLRRIELNRPKPEAPRSTATTPTACDEFLREWGEFATDGTAVDEEIWVRSCTSDNILTTVCWLSDFFNNPRSFHYR